MKHQWSGLILLMVIPALCPGVTIGQTDTFESGTLEQWTVALGPGGGVPNPAWAPANTTGGPGGAADHFLLLRSLGGVGAGSRLTVMNVTSWAGDYVAAGVNAISMDARNLGTTDLSLRLVFEKLGPMGPTDIAVSTVAIPLSAGGGWTSITFPIGPGSLTPVLGSVAAVLADVDVLRIYHGAAPVFPPEGIIASLGVDNIAASAVPEPSTMLLGAVALAGILAFRKR